jgi:hypothetical protein
MKQTGFNPTYDSPHEAFLASAMGNAGLPWPRKPLGGKPQMSKTGKSGRTGARTPGRLRPSMKFKKVY